MTIYAITKGTFSDYHICAVTTSEKKAEALRKIYTDRLDEARIEEFEDGDSPDDVQVMWLYFVGNPHVGLTTTDNRRDHVIYATNDKRSIVGAVVLAPDEEHAMKKAQDLIAREKAINEYL